MKYERHHWQHSHWQHRTLAAYFRVSEMASYSEAFLCEFEKL